MEEGQQMNKLSGKRLRDMILFEDENLLVLNKPSGMLSIPDRALSDTSAREMLLEKYPEVYTVHRLDKDTSGLILFARNAATHKYLNELFQNRQVDKFYIGIVKGKPIHENGILDQPIMENPQRKGTMMVHRKGRASQTGYEVLESSDNWSLVKFRLFTGRTHQIRVHCKDWGHPLAMDPIYGDGQPIFLSSIIRKYKTGKFEIEKPLIDRLALHAATLNYQDEQGVQKVFDAPIPKEFSVLFHQIAKTKNSPNRRS